MKLTERKTVTTKVYAMYTAQTIQSVEGDTSTWSFLATDQGNVWYNSRKTLDESIEVGKDVTITVYKYLPGTHNARTGRANKHFNVYLDNSHLS